MKKLAIFLAIVSIVAIATAATNLNQYSLQQVLNILAGNSRPPYTQYSTQQAANLFLANQPPFENDSLVAMITFIFDDNIGAANWDSVNQALWSVPAGARGANAWKFKAGWTVEPGGMLHFADTTATLSADRIRTLYNRGNDMGTVGWKEYASMWNNDTGLVATGNMTSSMQRFRDSFNMAVACQRDTMGIGTPRWVSWSHSGATWWQKSIVKQAGIEYGFCPYQTASVGSGSGTRPNIPFPLKTILVNSGTHETYGMNNVDGAYVACVPGLVQDRYEILQCIGEQNDSTQTRKTIQKAIAVKGGVVWLGHSFVSWDKALEDGDKDDAGDVGGAGMATPSGVMSMIAKYVRQGRLRVVTPSEFADRFYKYRPGPGANWIQPNFRDTDGDGNIDNWLCRTSAQQFPGTNVTAIPTNGSGTLSISSSGYRGQKTAAMKWTGVNGASANATLPDGNKVTVPWLSSCAVTAIYGPPQGWICHVEFAVREDTTKCSLVAHGGDGGTADGNPHTGGGIADSVGVAFWGSRILKWNKWGYSPAFLSVRDLNNSYGLSESYTGATEAVPGQMIKLAGRQRNATGTAGEWGTYEGEFPVADGIDVLYISFWKGGRQQSESIQISDVFIGFRPQGPSQN